MKYLILIALLIASNAFAIDLEVYGGKVIAARNYGLASSENPQYVAGIKVEEEFLWRHLTLATDVQTLMDGRVSNSLAKGADGFHPTSINFGVAADINIYGGVGLRVTHNCWHTLNSSWAATQQWTNAMLFYRFKSVGQ